MAHGHGGMGMALTASTSQRVVKIPPAGFHTRLLHKRGGQIRGCTVHRRTQCARQSLNMLLQRYSAHRWLPPPTSQRVRADARGMAAARSTYTYTSPHMVATGAVRMPPACCAVYLRPSRAEASLPIANRQLPIAYGFPAEALPIAILRSAALGRNTTLRIHRRSHVQSRTCHRCCADRATPLEPPARSRSRVAARRRRKPTDSRAAVQQVVLFLILDQLARGWDELR